MFDWMQFLDNQNIEYATSGPNVSRGNVAVHCPFCGSDDPSQHMVIGLKGSWYSCWRNREHRGKDPARLVQALLGCTHERARQLVGNAVFIPEDFLGRVHQYLEGPQPQQFEPLTMPTEFREFNGQPSSRPYVKYLHGRGFTDGHISRLTRRYDLRYCTRGPFGYRIIVPVTQGGALQTWVGRSITTHPNLRYKGLTVDKERAVRDGYGPALKPLPQTLLGFDSLLGGEYLVLVEGPFDALKVAALGRKYAIDATCCFTASPSTEQIDQLHEIAPRYKKRVLMLDAGTLPTAVAVLARLSGLGFQISQLPSGVKDPGELTEKQLLHLCH